ncbi:MAG: Mur ligase family protein, partial [Pirellulales bacterium]
QDKELTRSLLRAIGIPAPEGRPVESADDAWAAAEEIGLPVVVKPQYGNQGRGVATNLNTREQVVAAYAAAQQQESTVMVERFAPGADYRLLVIGGRVVAAARREPAQVFGDGVRTVRELVDEVNLDPRRGEDHATCLSKIPLDAVSLAVLADQGYTVDSIPPAGTKVLIRRNANLSTGGTATDVTDEIHPEVAARAVDAAKMVGLDIAGVDLVALDVSRPIEELRGVVVEVNAAPGLRMHLEPSSGKARPVGEAIVATLFGEGETGRIPIVAVTGVNGKTTTTRFIAHLVAAQGLKVGMSSTDGIYIDGRRVDKGDCSGPLSARSVLMHPSVEAAVLETARGGILRAGLGFDRCDVAVVTNIGEGDHLGLSDVETV